MRRTGLILALMVALPLPATGQDGAAVSNALTISITGVEWGSGKAVPIRVTRKKGEERTVIPALDDSPGVVQFDETECSYAVTYLAQPVPSILYNGVKPQTCHASRHAYQFVFRRMAEPSILTADFTYGFFTGLEPASYGEAPKIIRKFANSGDWGSAAFVSTEVAVALRERGDYQGSASFQSVAVAAGLQAVEDATTLQDGMPPIADVFGTSPNLGFEPLLTTGPASLVPTSAGEAAIASYQSANNLPVTGKLDWPTLRSTSSLAGENIEALGQFKIEALTSLD